MPPYVARLSEQGVDRSGPEINVYPTPLGNLANATFDQSYFAEDTGRQWVCVGNGVWAVLGAPGIAGPGGAGTYGPLIKSVSGLADNTPVNLAVVTIPNVIAGGGLAFTVSGVTGDGDSAQTSYWTCAVSRVAGANAKLTLSAIQNAINTAGVTATAAVAVSSLAVSGGVGAVNTFQLQIKVSRTTGASTGHAATCLIEVLNEFGGGITVA
jgi:hypothetical protein